MKKQLGKKAQRTAKTLQLYANLCSCGSCSSVCSGCGSVPSDDFTNVKQTNLRSLYQDYSYNSL
jgi:hypothetical protein